MSIRKGSAIISGNGGAGGGSAMNVDNITTSLNEDSEIQAIGVIEKNKSEPIYDWVGTYEEWTTARRNNEIDDSWICYITDDEVGTKKSSKQRTLGEIIFSLIEMDDPSLHMLDGTLIDGTGLYNGFYTYMKNLYDNGYTSSFTTESNWQSSVTTYGACGKFVLDTTNQTIRLPQLQGFVEGTLDEDAVGELVEAGLPNITGEFGVSIPAKHSNTVSGSFSGSTLPGGNYNSSAVCNDTANPTYGFTLDASRSSSIYGNSDTVQPQSIKGFYYIVLATSVNIDIEIAATDLLNTKADKDLVNTGYLTNCITEIPQDIKLELNNGVLTLKAGSKVYVPNGFESDGTTPKFDVIVTEVDADWVSTETSATRLGYYIPSSENFINGSIVYTYSGDTTTMNSKTPYSYAKFYNTETNKMYSGNGSSWVENYFSLPVCLFTNESTSVISLDQVFNGFGYIGSTLFALPGIKGLIPNGRNADGSLKSIPFETSSVLTNTNTYSYNGYLAISSTTLDASTYKNYSEKDNYYYTNTGEVYPRCICGIFNRGTNGVITVFSTKQPFRSTDLSDAANAAMPSSKYIDITLGASGSEYVAPANGYYYLQIRMNAAGNGATIANRSNGMQKRCPVGTTNTLSASVMEVRRGDTIAIDYPTLSSTTSSNVFRFYYAEGEL